jgi:hypothetical protein
MCIPSEDREKLHEIANNTTDDLLPLAISLILRGSMLPKPVAQRLLNAGAAMLDAHDVAKRIVGRTHSKEKR